NYASELVVHIIGGGVMGLAAGIELARLRCLLSLDFHIHIYEVGALGGGPDDKTAGPRCQLWLHTDGQLYAGSQPAVSLALQWSTQRLQELAPHAFAYPLALTLEPPHEGPPLP